MENLEKLIVARLKDMLKDKGLSTKGNKRKLILRLQEELYAKDMDNVQSNDSVSNVGTHSAVSNASAKSLLSVRRAEESAKRAALEKKHEMISKRYEMKLKELKF